MKLVIFLHKNELDSVTVRITNITQVVHMLELTFTSEGKFLVHLLLCNRIVSWNSHLVSLNLFGIIELNQLTLYHRTLNKLERINKNCMLVLTLMINCIFLPHRPIGVPSSLVIP